VPLVGMELSLPCWRLFTEQEILYVFNSIFCFFELLFFSFYHHATAVAFILFAFNKLIVYYFYSPASS